MTNQWFRVLLLVPLAWQGTNVQPTTPYLQAAELQIVAVPRREPENRADVIVYGGTPAGIAAAAAVAREGRTVILIEPSKHLGGVVAGGLGATDKGIERTIGGLSRRYFEMVGEHYGKPIAWAFEPHVAELTFEKWLAEIDDKLLTIVPEERLHLSLGVRTEDHRIVAIQMESGRLFSGRVFVDASYEGDLVAGAGVSYHVGRESREQYGEPLAGVLEPGKGGIFQPKQDFPDGVSPFKIPDDPSSGLLPGIQRAGLEAPGSADTRLQAYNFRICLTTDAANRIPITKPARYDSARYELLGRALQMDPSIVLRRRGGKAGLFMISSMPGHKTDINDGGPFSTDHIGANWDYPEGDYETRARIVEDHVDFTKGLLWFIASDPRVPENVRKEMRQYGYPRDEYPDNDHWSHQLYVRETRRMVGARVLTEQDCLRTDTQKDSVGMGSYAPDSHHVQRVVLDGKAVNEGNFYLRHHAYEIPYGVLTPKKAECSNLLVPVCLSASHVAFGSVRMEPVFMILGESSGVAASMAIEASARVQDVNVAALQKKLLGYGQRLKLPKQKRATKSKRPPAVVAPEGGMLIDDTKAEFTGTWSVGRGQPLVGKAYRHDRETPKGTGKVAFRFRVPADGDYALRLVFRPHSNRVRKLPVMVTSAGGEITKVTIDQRQGAGNLGTFRLVATQEATVEFANSGTRGVIVADGLRVSPRPR